MALRIFSKKNSRILTCYGHKFPKIFTYDFYKKKVLPESSYFSSNYVTVAKTHLNKQEIEVTFIKKSGERIIGKGKEGDSLLDVVVNNNLDFDGFGACEGTLTCSTCHVILKQTDYDRLPEKPTDEEFDMLDLAYDLCDTSRLGCQIQLTKDLNGLEVELPATINDARAQ